MAINWLCAICALEVDTDRPGPASLDETYGVMRNGTTYCFDHYLQEWSDE